MKIDLDTLPDETVMYIAKLRREASRMRVQRNAARRDFDQAMERIRELHADNERMRAELAEVSGK